MYKRQREDLGDINYYVDACEMTVSPVEKGSEGIATDTSYFNVTFKTDSDDLSGELKQELLFMTTDVVPIMAKCLVGQLLETDTYSLPSFSWFYEDSTTKGSESLEIQSSYQLQQMISKPTKGYNFTSYVKTSERVNALTTFSLVFNRYFEARNSGIASFSHDTGSGFMTIEGYTVSKLSLIHI